MLPTVPLSTALLAGSRKLEYNGQTWHEHCFICSSCQQPIGSRSFIPDKKDYYCVPCYESKFAPRCTRCKKVCLPWQAEPWSCAGGSCFQSRGFCWLRRGQGAPAQPSPATVSGCSALAVLGMNRLCTSSFHTPSENDSGASTLADGCSGVALPLCHTCALSSHRP